MDLKPGKEPISNLIDSANEGKLVLPEFQRSFVWNRQDVEELIVSILNGYYIGTFLLLDVDPYETPFSPRAIEGVEKDLDPRRMVLDGQQRITSIFYALNSHNFDEERGLGNTKYTYEFFVDMEETVNKNWEEAVFSRKKGGRKHSKYDTKEKCMSENVMPVRSLKDGEERLKWGMEYKEKTGNDELWEGFKEYAKEFNEFQVAIVELKRETELDTIVEIFERINRTGENLSVFELLTARLYKEDLELRELWKEVYEDKENFSHIRKFSDDIKDEKYQKHVLRTMALIRGNEPKRKNLITLDSENFKQDWETASKYVENALMRLNDSQHGFGALDPSWLPYSGMVSATAAMLHMIENKGDKGTYYKKLSQWYWSSIFAERYTSATATLSHRDLEDLEKWIEDGEEMDALMTENQLEDLNLREKARKGGVYKGIMCMVALEGPEDFYTGDPDEFNQLEDHHIFPKNHLKNNQVPETLRNTIINRTLIKDKTNKKIKDQAPSDYIEDMEESLGSSNSVYQVLSNHLINEEAVDAMKEDNYKKFLQNREAELKQKISIRTGIGETE
jgi:hypothetical protein